jgi:hypothetical protein
MNVHQLWQLSGIPAAPNLARAICHKQFSLSCVWSNPAIQEIPSPHRETIRWTLFRQLSTNS